MEMGSATVVVVQLAHKGLGVCIASWGMVLLLGECIRLAAAAGF